MFCISVLSTTHQSGVARWYCDNDGQFDLPRTFGEADSGVILGRFRWAQSYFSISLRTYVYISYTSFPQMAPESYEIDPNGDVLLTLRNPRPSFALWDETQDDPSNRPEAPSLDTFDEIWDTQPALTKKEKRKRQKRALNARQVLVPESPVEPFDNVPAPAPEPVDDLPALPPAPFDNLPAPPEPFDDLPPPSAPTETFGEAVPLEPSDELPRAPAECSNGRLAASNENLDSLDKAPIIDEYVQIRVSSHHLALASLYYMRMLKGKFKEAETLRENGIVEVEVEDIDADALLILMKIIHGKTRAVPKEIPLEVLAKIAVIVNWYQCHEAVEVFTDMWIAHLNTDLPKVYGRDAVLWVLISLVFRKHDEFHSVTGLALKYSSGSFQDLGLPIPQSIFGKCYSVRLLGY